MTIWLWVGFVFFVIGMLALDLGVFTREAHVVGSAHRTTRVPGWAMIPGLALIQQCDADTVDEMSTVSFCTVIDEQPAMLGQNRRRACPDFDCIPCRPLPFWQNAMRFALMHQVRRTGRPDVLDATRVGAMENSPTPVKLLWEQGGIFVVRRKDQPDAFRFYQIVATCDCDRRPT